MDDHNGRRGGEHSKNTDFLRPALITESRVSFQELRNEYTKAVNYIDILEIEKNNLSNALKLSTNRKQEHSHNTPGLLSSRSSSHLNSNAYTQHHNEKKLIQLDQENRELKKLLAEHSKPDEFLENEKKLIMLRQENSELRKALETNNERLNQTQRQNYNHHDQLYATERLEKRNKQLCIEVDFLNREVQSITRRLQELEEENLRLVSDGLAPCTTSLETVQSIMKYVDYVLTTISTIPSSHFIRSCFNERFQTPLDVHRLLNAKDYGTLLLKSSKYISDLLINIDVNSLPSTKVSSLTSPTGKSFAVDGLSHKDANSPAKQKFVETGRPITPIVPVHHGNSSLASSMLSAMNKAGDQIPSSSSLGSKKGPLIKRQGRTLSQQISQGCNQTITNEGNYQSGKQSKNSSVTPEDAQTAKQVDSSQRAGNLTSRSNESKSRNAPNTDQRKEVKSRNVLDTRERRVKNNSMQLSKGSSILDSSQLKKQSLLMEKERQLIEIDRQLKQKERDISELDKTLNRKEYIHTGTFNYPTENPVKDRSDHSQYVREDGGSVIRLQAALNSGQITADNDYNNKVYRDGIRRSDSFKRIKAPAHEVDEDCYNTAPTYREDHQDYDSRYKKILPFDVTSPTQESSTLRERNLYNRYDSKSRFKDVAERLEDRYKKWDVKQNDEDPPYATFRDQEHQRSIEDAVYQSKTLPKPQPMDRPEELNGSLGKLRAEDLSPIVKVYHTTRARDNAYDDFEYSPQQKLITFDTPELDKNEDQSRSAANSRVRGANYPTFNVSFGRTETRLKLSPSPQSRHNNNGVLDIPRKGRVTHIVQTYDVIKGEEMVSKAREDKATHKYEVSPATPLNGKASVSGGPSSQS